MTAGQQPPGGLVQRYRCLIRRIAFGGLWIFNVNRAYNC